jgi:hypothetical protein
MTPWVYLDTDDPLRACLFPMCAEGSTNVYKEEDGCYENTPGDGQPVDADGKPLPPIVWKVRTESGFRGCCRVGRGRVTAKFDCAHFSTKFDAYYWVDGGDETLGANACPTYTLSYGPQ